MITSPTYEPASCKCWTSSRSRRTAAVQGTPSEHAELCWVVIKAEQLSHAHLVCSAHYVVPPNAEGCVSYPSLSAPAPLSWTCSSPSGHRLWVCPWCLALCDIKIAVLAEIIQPQVSHNAETVISTQPHAIHTNHEEQTAHVHNVMHSFSTERNEFCTCHFLWLPLEYGSAHSAECCCSSHQSIPPVHPPAEPQPTTGLVQHQHAEGHAHPHALCNSSSNMQRQSQTQLGHGCHWTSHAYSR